MNKKESKAIDDVFDLSIFLKGIDGILELLGAAILLIFGTEKINSFLSLITRHEILKDPKDIIANALLRFGQSLSLSTYHSTIIFLLLHGAVKVFLVTMLFLKKLWAYPVAIITFALFGVYQIYQYYLSPSGLLIYLTILDFIVVILTIIEYRNMKNKQKLQA